MLGTLRAPFPSTPPGSPFSSLLSKTGGEPFDEDDAGSERGYPECEAGPWNLGAQTPYRIAVWPPQTGSAEASQAPADPTDSSEIITASSDVQKAMVSDPRKKLLSRLSQEGLLSGAQNRRRQERDLKDYPDIAALAHVAKTKENFYEIMGSPQARQLDEVTSIKDPGWSPAPAAGRLTASPTSTSAGSESLVSYTSESSPEWLPRIHGDVLAFDLNTATDAEALEAPPLPFSMERQKTAPPDIGRPRPSRLASPPPEQSRCVDLDRADLLWKLAGSGSPQLKPLDSPETETDGSTKTGVYLLSSPKVGPCDAPRLPIQTIFKPLDEEDFERRGIEIGMGALREEAAFVIDRASGGLAHVPVTARASVDSKKGSIQQFVEESVGPVEDFGMPRDLEAAEAFVGLDNAQAVACFDIRIFNTDRHAGNLLLAGPRPHKINCIDHGCVLPAWWALESCSFDAWLDWPHVRAPASSATLSLVTQVVDTLPMVVQELEKLGLPTQAIWTLEICTSLLQKCVLFHGLTLRSVALLMTRADPAEPSWLERTVADACASAGVAAEFEPQGKYGDLMLKVDQKILNWFLAPEGALFDAKHLSNFRDAFFIFLNSAFTHTDVISAAQVAEDAARSPWD